MQRVRNVHRLQEPSSATCYVRFDLLRFCLNRLKACLGHGLLSNAQPDHAAESVGECCLLGFKLLISPAQVSDRLAGLLDPQLIEARAVVCQAQGRFSATYFLSLRGCHDQYRTSFRVHRGAPLWLKLIHFRGLLERLLDSFLVFCSNAKFLKLMTTIIDDRLKLLHAVHALDQCCHECLDLLGKSFHFREAIQAEHDFIDDVLGAFSFLRAPLHKLANLLCQHLCLCIFK
mmetsp:Transcript_17892/g.31369  ORF Transcript_17892/g.31369 Transcript_17892/m.31369 type:complete len:231 (+) Transcript_17892:1497-2189(+)